MSFVLGGSVIVYERDGAWSRAVRRWAPPEIAVIETPPFEQVALRRDLPCVILAVVSGPADAQPTLAWARRWLVADVRTLRMAVVRPANGELAWCLRETGIRMIWDEFWQVSNLARITRDYCRRHKPADLSVEQRIWNNLPWSAHESGLERGGLHGERN